jgi:aspartyl-tRNA(Asn)/glutamyl-tRNA(Gln) amidotransferase subunit C
MSLDRKTVENCAYLARLQLKEQDLPEYTENLSRIMNFIDQMKDVDTSDIQPMSHPLEMNQRLREDVVTATNQRDAFQAIAPAVEKGLYLVPRVVE